MARDTIALTELSIDCVVGVYPHERDMAQPLLLDVELGLDTEEAALSERLSRSIDYDFTAAQIAFLLQSCRFRLLETAAHVLARLLLAPPAPGERRARVESLRLRLTKPEALGGVAVPSVAIERVAEQVSLSQEHKPFGTVDVLHETRDAGVYRLNLEPGGVIPLHVHRRMQESEMILSEQLFCQGRPMQRGTVHRWPLDAPHTYANRSDHWQTILCVDSPPFLEEDEIPVEGEPADVAPEPAWPSRRDS